MKENYFTSYWTEMRKLLYSQIKSNQIKFIYE